MFNSGKTMYTREVSFIAKRALTNRRVSAQMAQSQKVKK